MNDRVRENFPLDTSSLDLLPSAPLLTASINKGR